MSAAAAMSAAATPLLPETANVIFSPLSGDAVLSFVSIHEALKIMMTGQGRKLGDVENGATVGEPGDEDGKAQLRMRSEYEAVESEHDESSDEASESTRRTAFKLKKWARSVGAALHRVNRFAAFACGGVVFIEPYHKAAYDERHALVIVDAAGAVVARVQLDDAERPLNATALLPFCVEAGFGNLRLQTTEVDASVRAAVEMRAATTAASAAAGTITRSVTAAPAAAAEGGSSTNAVAAAATGAGTPSAAAGGSFTFWLQYLRTGIEPAVTVYRQGRYVDVPGAHVVDKPCTVEMLLGIKSEIAAALTGEEVELVPYKLNVYGPGGFFKPHVDTPSVDSARMLGTLIVSLPSRFEGGTLVVWPPTGTDNGSSTGAPASSAPVVFDWAPRSGEHGTLQWAALYGDCVHEVRPVTAGHRVTLTYAIVAMGSHRHVNKVPDTETQVATATALVTQRLAATVLPLLAARPPEAAAAFGLLLSHRYTLTGAAAGALKGPDAALLSALVAAGYDVEVAPVAYRANIYRGFAEGESARVATNYVYSFTTEDIAALRDAAARPRHLRGAPLQLPPLPAPAPHIPFVRVSTQGCGRLDASGEPPVGLQLAHEETVEGEYTGNEADEARDDTIYFYAALLVRPGSAAVMAAAADLAAATGTVDESNIFREAGPAKAAAEMAESEEENSAKSEELSATGAESEEHSATGAESEEHSGSKVEEPGSEESVGPGGPESEESDSPAVSELSSESERVVAVAELVDGEEPGKAKRARLSEAVDELPLDGVANAPTTEPHNHTNCVIG